MTLAFDIKHRLGDFLLDARCETGGGLIALFGRSGSGKSSIINVIAGLIRPDEARITIDGVPLIDTARGIFVPRHKRRIGYVFQEGRLFPHLTVRQNLLYGNWFSPAGEQADDLDDVVELLGISGLLERRPGRLSGGEKQRVAIGRALLANPRVLLMDEPLASLDEVRKAEILPYIERLRDQSRVPIVYVSPLDRRGRPIGDLDGSPIRGQSRCRRIVGGCHAPDRSVPDHRSRGGRRRHRSQGRTPRRPVRFDRTQLARRRLEVAAPERTYGHEGAPARAGPRCHARKNCSRGSQRAQHRKGGCRRDGLVGIRDHRHSSRLQRRDTDRSPDPLFGRAVGVTSTALRSMPWSRVSRSIVGMLPAPFGQSRERMQKQTTRDGPSEQSLSLRAISSRQCLSQSSQVSRRCGSGRTLDGAIPTDDIAAELSSGVPRRRLVRPSACRQAARGRSD